jgi:hypothetical protein
VFTDGKVAIAIAPSAGVKAERMRHLIADFDAGQNSASRKSRQQYQLGLVSTYQMRNIPTGSYLINPCVE